MEEYNIKEKIYKPKVLRKVFIIVTIIIVVPFLINYILRDGLNGWKPIKTNMTPNDWFIFLGTYIGALISAIITICGVYIAIKGDNHIMKKEMQYQAMPLLNVNFFQDKEYIKESDRNVYKKFSVNKQGNLINHGWNMNFKNIDWIIGMNVGNIGLGPAINIDTYIYELKNIEGLNELSEFLDKDVDNFYDKIYYENYNYEERGSIKKDAWQIFTSFSVSKDDNSGRWNILFEFEESVSEMYNILEFKYEDIYQNEYSQLVFFWIDNNNKRSEFYPISKQ